MKQDNRLLPTEDELPDSDWILCMTEPIDTATLRNEAQAQV